MDYERLLIDKAAQASNVEALLLAGIREDHIESEENQKVFSFLTDHYRKYRISPSFETVRNEFSERLFELNTESLDFFKDEFLKLVKRRHAITAIRELAHAIDDPTLVGDIDSLFLEKSRYLAQAVPSSAVSRFTDMEERIENYEIGEDRGNTIEMGIPDFDYKTSGIQPHEYITILGYSGKGKSTLAQWILFNAWMQGKTPMYISLEMGEAKALYRKWDTMAMNFEYNRLKRGTLHERDIERWKERAKEIRNAANDIIVLDDVRGCTVDRVFAEITRYQPDIVCIDYITLMDAYKTGGQTWEKVMYLTQALKQTARTLKTPIVGVAQTNRSAADTGATTENTGYGFSIVQDSDIVVGLHQDEDMREEQRMELRLLKNRDGETGDTSLLWKMKTMEFAPWRDAHAFLERDFDTR